MTPTIIGRHYDTVSYDTVSQDDIIGVIHPKEAAALAEVSGDEVTQALYPADTEPTPEQVEKLTETNRRKLMRQFWTIQHPVASCGHKLDPRNDPRTNCEVCWFTWFNYHGELVQTADEMFQKHGIETIRQMRGDRFAKMFVRFMATLATSLKEVKDVSSTEGIATGGSESGPEGNPETA